MLEKTPVFQRLNQREIFTPTSLAARLQQSFNHDFSNLWVEGEIAELSLSSSGHAYFILKDREAQLRAVMWKSRRAYAETVLIEGMAVLARGRLSLYALRGNFQLVVDYLEPQGEGALRLAFKQMKTRLTAEGFFDETRKRPLSYWPAKVAVISSATGAAARDFIQTALARRPGAAISLYPVRVQGPGAVAEIVLALEDLNAWGGFDLIVLIRGGGSLADLWAFNEEAVVRAVAASRIVTLAAIGHSTDLSLTELAADARAITPTAAAEAVFRDQGALLTHLVTREVSLARAVTELLTFRSTRLEEVGHILRRELIENYTRRRDKLNDLFRSLGRFEDRWSLNTQKLSDLTRRLLQSASKISIERRNHLDNIVATLRFIFPAGTLFVRRRELAGFNDRLVRAWAVDFENLRKRLNFLQTRLRDLSPGNILKRGYALVLSKTEGTLITSSNALTVGEEISVHLAEGIFIAEVKDIK
ncbi:MAG: exodeoxyribonuclease VII large subunit [Candidatus Adiutrix intracellularis]|nr:exodeoxyribonuclease VII large subunit [Candidatus Adiutrix intracellularis]